MEKENKVLGEKNGELNINKEELDQELLEFNLEDVDEALDDINIDDINIDDINFDDVQEDDIDFDFEDLSVENFDEEIQMDSIEADDSQSEEVVLTNEKITKVEKENFDTDGLVTEELSNHLEENFDNIDLDVLTEENTDNSKDNFNLDGLLTEGTTNEEKFDLDGLLEEEVTDDLEEENFDMDGLSFEENTSELEDAVKEDSILTEENLDGLEQESLDENPDVENPDAFSFDGLFDSDLDFATSLEDNSNAEGLLEGQDINLDNLTDVLDSSVLDAMPDAEEMIVDEAHVKKKKGLFSRLFGNVKDDKWEKQKELEAQKEEEKRLKAEEKQKAEEETEEGEKELTKAEKKAAKKAEKEAKKAAKKQAKEEKKAQEKEADVEEVIEDEGRINKVGASIVFVFFAACAIAVVAGTSAFSYNQSIKNATNLFGVKKYTQAYEQIQGVKIKSKDEEICNKIMTVMYVDKQLNSYYNYYGIKLYPEALDSLLKGLGKYDKYLYEAKQLGIKSDFDYVKDEILTELGNTFEVSEQEAYDMIDMEDKEKYSEKVRKIANGEE